MSVVLSVAKFMRKPWTVVILVISLHFSLGAYFAGDQFLRNLTTAIPTMPIGGNGGSQFMVPGDHFEQFYRYSLPRHNIEGNKSIYESGYQYNLSADTPAFSEGWVFFPFSMLNAGLSFFVGDIASYNLIALLSFPLVGGAMYWLVFFLIRSHPAALLSSLLLALLPHRTSFLFGEMVYGVDLMWPPLIVLAFEHAIRTFQMRYAALFGVVLFFYATSNFQAFYLFSVFSLPYFAFRAFQTAKQEWVPITNKIRQSLAILVSMLPALLYLLWIRSLLSASGLSSGQGYAETTLYSPTLQNAISVWSGNEKTIYLGWPLFLVLVLLLTIGASGYLRRTTSDLAIPERSVFILAGLIFAISYLFCFGPNLDTMLNINIYRWYFDHFPGANSTRTPGRLMNTVGFYFALFFGLFVHLTITRWKNPRVYRRLIWPLTLIIAFAIVYNYHYTKPLLVKLDPHNAAYESIRGTPGIVYTVPTQVEAPHYFNATFLYYAQKYDLHIFSGHSSMYPKEWDRIIGDFLPINDGLFNNDMMKRFKDRGITHLVVHTTTFEPNVPSSVLKMLKQSPYLHQVSEADGITVFSIDYEAAGKQVIRPNKLLKSVQLRTEDYGKFIFSDGWYAKEAYPGQRPFRWMHGTEASGVIYPGNIQLNTAEFVYWCPLNDLSIIINNRKITSVSKDLGDGWRKMIVKLTHYGKGPFIFELYTPKLFKSPPDIREFGCQIGDVTIH